MDAAASGFPQMRTSSITQILAGIGKNTPIWLLGQTGQYLDEFKEMLRKHGYAKIIRNPKLACQATLIPVQKFKFDVAVIYTDLYLPIEAMGLAIKMDIDGPTVPNKLQLETAGRLNVTSIGDRMRFLADAISKVRVALNGEACLSGVSATPWDLFSCMINGNTSGNSPDARKCLYTHPEESMELLNKLAEVVIQNSLMQIRAGAQCIRLFETQAAYLAKDTYVEFCLPGLKEIRSRVRNKVAEDNLEPVPMGFYSSGLEHSLNEVASADFDIIGLDWRKDPICAKSSVAPKSPCFEGNLDPEILFATPDEISVEVTEMMRQFEGHKYIANVGDVLPPDTPLDGVYAFVEAVRSYNENGIEAALDSGSENKRGTTESSSSATVKSSSAEPSLLSDP